MRQLTELETKEISGGYVWFCKTCGYISNDHWYRNTATNMARKHEQKKPGHKTTVK